MEEISATIDMKKDFSNIHNLLAETSSLNKPMAFRVRYKNRDIVVKRTDVNGIDCLILDECKEIFGLNPIGNMMLFKSLYDISKKTKKIFKNKKNAYKIFIAMTYLENSFMIFENIDVLLDDRILYEYLKCALYRGIFRVTDFCSKNIIISNGNVYSIDENDIGKQKRIVKQKDINNYMKNKKKIKEVVDKIIYNFLLNINNKKSQIHATLLNYKRIEYYSTISNNINNLKRDIYEDLSLEY